MALRVVGAGLPRTGTLSLKTALEKLLGAKCYHMVELFEHPEHGPTWADISEGKEADLTALLDGYAAAVDAPAMMVWRQLADANPDSVILLSRRETPQQWVRSMENTIFPRIRETQRLFGSYEEVPEDVPAQVRTMARMFAGMAEGMAKYVDDPEAAAAWYEQYNADVRATAPPARLLEWTAADGWEPLCTALGVPVPDEPFPRVNSSEEFQERVRDRGVLGMPAGFGGEAEG
ncbi:MAG TPA: sulfotransferase [Streptosporangiaceae bacterium]